MECDKQEFLVYIHILPKSITGYNFDKYYVGITRWSAYHRWGKDGIGYRKQDKFYKAIQKYGWDSFEHEIIAEHLTEEEAKNFEIMLISKLQCNDHIHGYNIDPGGSSHASLGIPVAAYDLDGNFVKLYSSYSAASEDTGICVQNMCNDIRAGKYVWIPCKDKNPSDHILPYKYLIHPEKVYKIGIDGRILEEMYYIDALREYGPHIGSAVYGRSITSRGFQWRFTDSDPSEIKSLPGVFRYDMDGNYQKSYLSKRQAVFDVGGTEFDKIKNEVFNDLYDNARFGYRWTNKYVEKLPQFFHLTNRSRPVIEYNNEHRIIHIYPKVNDLLKQLGISNEKFCKYYINNPSTNINGRYWCDFDKKDEFGLFTDDPDTIELIAYATNAI